MERNVGENAPTFRHGWTADCALPAIFRLCRVATGGSLMLPCTDYESMSPTKARCGLFVVALAATLFGSPAGAQNLDQGKPPAKLFAEGCASCHRSPRGLAKGRFRLSLYLFLQKHYVSGSSSAWALSSYLESIDSAKRVAAKPASTGASRSSMRPPAPVPAR
jgi:hypothetical protein